MGWNILELLSQSERCDEELIKSLFVHNKLHPEVLSEVLPTTKEVLKFLTKKNGWLAEHRCDPVNVVEKVPAIIEECELSAEECRLLIQELDDEHYHLLSIFLPRLKKKVLEKLFDSCGKQRIRAYLAAKLSKIEFIDLACLKSENLHLLNIYSANCNEKARENLIRKIREIKSTSLDEVRKSEALKAVRKYCPDACCHHVVETSTSLANTPSIPMCKYLMYNQYSC